MAFEYQGEHHYFSVSPFVRRGASRGESLERIQSKDNLKVRLCKERGITLIVIPFVKSKDFHVFRAAVASAAAQAGVDTRLLERLGEECLAGSLRNNLVELGRLAAKKGGLCLSVAYFGQCAKYLWKCSNGHEWKAMARNIKRGSWCRECKDASAGRR